MRTEFDGEDGEHGVGNLGGCHNGLVLANIVILLKVVRVVPLSWNFGRFLWRDGVVKPWRGWAAESLSKKVTWRRNMWLVKHWYSLP